MVPVRFSKFEMPFSEFMSVVPERYHPADENVFGSILEEDFSSSHIQEDPLIANFAEANHFLDYNMSLRRIRLFLRFKFFFADIFSRKPKRNKRKRQV